MKIVVTGASGFIGTELLAVLKSKENMEAIGLTREASIAEATDCLEWRSTDYSVESLVSAISGADAVIHLAGVRGTEAETGRFAINEEMTDNLLKAMIEACVPRIVFASTVSVYDDEDLIPWTEDAPLKGRTEYGNSKIKCERLIERYSSEYGVSYGIARIAQVLGTGEKRRGMMNVFLDTAKEQGTLKVMGKSIAKRQYIYVKDVAKVLAILAEESRNMIINVGMPHAYSNLEIATIINKVYDNKTPIDYDDTYPEKGRAFCMDISKLKMALGYEPLDMNDAMEDLKS